MARALCIYILLTCGLRARGWKYRYPAYSRSAASLIKKNVVSPDPNDYFDLGLNNTVKLSEDIVLNNQTWCRAHQYYLDTRVEDASIFVPIRKGYWTTFTSIDTPDGIGDCERIKDMRRRGMNVCNGGTPDYAVCRVKGKKYSKFTADTGIPPNLLAIKCSPVDGIVCLNKDQKKGKRCEDYEIQFHCPRQILTDNVYGTLFVGLQHLRPKSELPPRYMAKRAAKYAVVKLLMTGLRRPCVRRVNDFNLSIDVRNDSVVRQYYEIQISGVIRERKVIVDNFLYTVWVDAVTIAVFGLWREGDLRLNAMGIGGNDKIGEYYFGQKKGFLDVSEGRALQCVMSNSKVVLVHNKFTSETSNTLPHTYTCATGNTDAINGGRSPINDAHYHGTKMFEMFQAWFERGVVLSPPITIRVHFGDKLDIARYDPPSKSVFLGDGHTVFHPMTDENVVGHEMAHAFILETSRLQNRLQSGAISESFADISGEALEFYLNGKVDWKVARSIKKGGALDALRYFDTPGIDGKSKSHFRDYSDSIDIHYTSGIFNRAFYKLATREGWGVKRAYVVFWLANVMSWKRCTGMAKAVCGVLDAAKSQRYSEKDIALAFFDVGLECTAAVRASSDQCG